MPRSTTLLALATVAATAVSCGDDAPVDGALGCYVARGSAEAALQRPSPLTEVRFSYGEGEGLLCYGAPSARGREVVGGLLGYGRPERIGANEPTTLHLSAPAVIGGLELEPGTYSLYAVLSPERWEFFVNSNWERWGIPIDESVRASEIGSFTATPEPIAEMVERLRYRWVPAEGGTMGDLVLEWEHTRVSFPLHPAD